MYLYYTIIARPENYEQLRISVAHANLTKMYDWK